MHIAENWLFWMACGKNYKVTGDEMKSNKFGEPEAIVRELEQSGKIKNANGLIWADKSKCGLKTWAKLDYLVNHRGYIVFR